MEVLQLPQLGLTRREKPGSDRTIAIDAVTPASPQIFCSLDERCLGVMRGLTSR